MPLPRACPGMHAKASTKHKTISLQDTQSSHYVGTQGSLSWSTVKCQLIIINNLLHHINLVKRYSQSNPWSLASLHKFNLLGRNRSGKSLLKTQAN